MDLIQTDSEGLAVNLIPGILPRLAAINGLPGRTTLSVKLPPDIGIAFESSVIGLSEWTAGVWTMQLRVVTGNPLIAWRMTRIWRINKQGSMVELLGTAYGSIPLAGAAVYAMEVQGAAQLAKLDDRAHIALAFSCESAQSFDYVPDQTIFTPL